MNDARRVLVASLIEDTGRRGIDPVSGGSKGGQNSLGVKQQKRAIPKDRPFCFRAF